MYLLFLGGGGHLLCILYKQNEQQNVFFFTVSELYSEKDSYSNVVCIRYCSYSILQYIIITSASLLFMHVYPDDYIHTCVCSQVVH